MSNFRSPPPAGATVIEIESDDCGKCELLTGRKWDPPAKPSFVNKSDGEWQIFQSTMKTRVKAYRRETIGTVLILPILVFSTILFHPAFGVVSRQMENNQDGTGIMMFMTLFGIGGGLAKFWLSRKANMQNDEKIKQLLRDMSRGSGATFVLATAWTNTCKPKGARTYRAVWIYADAAQGQLGIPMGVQVAPQPTDASMVLVSVPVGSSAGDTLIITAPSGVTVQVTVPPGVPEGDQFQVTLPTEAAPPPIVLGTIVATSSY